ncbi:MAG TPA: hypothetical protein VMZ53_33020 [Kofleriaceae bacterium]|nr:hypothetical protein [Kofleriaceae bacterium]
MHRYLVVIAIAACGNPSDPAETPDAAAPDAAVAPVFRNPVSLPDDQLAKQSLQILGAHVDGASDSCGGCHGMTRQRIRYWRALSDTTMQSCLTDLAVTDQASALQMISCARTMPDTATSDFTTKKLGIYATATRLPWFQFAFWRAYGDTAEQELAAFNSQVAMPKGDTIPPLTQEQFDIVAEWFARGVPMLDETLPVDPAPSTCTPGISGDVAAHVTAMATQGWRAVNRGNMMAMYGCGTATDPKQCLGDIPLASEQTYGETWDVGAAKFRVLRDVTYETSYWTRSSPDGRFIGHGVANVTGSYIYDLQRGANVTIATQYDPAFFPDNSGFVFQGGPRNVCGISVLTSNPTSIAMTEAACSKISTIGLYEHVGQGLGGGDYFAIDSQFVSDDGGKETTTKDPATDFTTTGYTDFTPMIFDGTKYVTKGRIHISQPFEGDSTLSPSARLEMTRVAGPNDKQIGFVLHKVVTTPTGSSYSITTPEIARYCISGGKPGFSYDERWVAYHHYETNGSANLYLMDLRTGNPIKISNMSPGQYALYPHFRSDGWIYAQVRDTNSGHEYTVATDAALLAE